MWCAANCIGLGKYCFKIRGSTHHTETGFSFLKRELTIVAREIKKNKINLGLIECRKLKRKTTHDNTVCVCVCDYDQITK